MTTPNKTANLLGNTTLEKLIQNKVHTTQAYGLGN